MQSQWSTAGFKRRVRPSVPARPQKVGSIPPLATIQIRNYRADDLFRAAAARMSVLKASSSISSPSWKSIARLALPSRLELNSPEGSLSEAPLEKVSFTTLLYVSPVQISPS